MKRYYVLEFCIAVCIVCLIVVLFHIFFAKDAELACWRSPDISLPNCTLVQTSIVNRKVTQITPLKAAYVNITKTVSRAGEITEHYSVSLLTDKGEVALSESYSSLAKQDVDQLNQFINSSQPSLSIKEEHLQEARSTVQIFGTTGLVFVLLSWLGYMKVIS
jgi:hypothetical protein